MQAASGRGSLWEGLKDIAEEGEREGLQLHTVHAGQCGCLRVIHDLSYSSPSATLYVILINSLVPESDLVCHRRRTTGRCLPLPRGKGSTAPIFRLFANLAEDPSSVPTTYTEAHNHLELQFQGSGNLF